MNALPSWLKANILVRHVPSGIFFTACPPCQTINGKTCLRDAPKGNDNANFYQLDECEPAKPEHFMGGDTVIYFGKVLTVAKFPGFIQLRMEPLPLVSIALPPPDPVRQAADFLADFYGGVVIDGSEVNL